MPAVGAETRRIQVDHEGLEGNEDKTEAFLTTKNTKGTKFL